MIKLDISKLTPLLLGLLLCPLSAWASDGTEVSLTRVHEINSASAGELRPVAPPVSFAGNLKGWDYLFGRLVSEGVDPQYLASIIRDPRMPVREPLIFGLNPKEPRALYRKHNSRTNRAHALRFYKLHKSTFAKAEADFGVPSSVILAILQIETSCGRNTGQEKAFFRLARLASSAAPENIQTNFHRKRLQDKLLKLEKVEDRALWLEQEFLPHTKGAIDVAQEFSLHPLELRGSSAGAIGLPQFLPGHVKNLGVDGDGDGRVNLFTPDDAIPSVARFLKEHGWDSPKPLSIKEQRKVIYAYNRSPSYVDTVLQMAASLKPQMK